MYLWTDWCLCWVEEIRFYTIICMYMYVHTYVYAYKCMYVSLCACMCVCMYAHSHWLIINHDFYFVEKESRSILWITDGHQWRICRTTGERCPKVWHAIDGVRPRGLYWLGEYVISLINFTLQAISVGPIKCTVKDSLVSRKKANLHSTHLSISISLCVNCCGYGRLEIG